MKRSLVSSWVLGGVLVALLVCCFVVGSGRSGGGEESFAGTDSVVTQMIADSGVQPWFEPIFEPKSGEVESGLFAVQAAAGGVLFGYCFGVLRERARRRGSVVAGVEVEKE
ncbi:Energy-coupling factor transporter probable substrate-capture protein CbiN [Dermatophilus congolensis]|uniref:Cobalt transport protein CbiN n=1 Tax=Dermatophilus congolensis TaxID=1863 RepID=A0A239VFD0_9MICO|nr:energy-coupling factor ABC transporter substrate-binding protein [Dermatophilus congolensis]SNV20915.1 Energy-coupling factor transporter probable substrate-capture protein CbiN [Dermatophilus congolensis]